MCASATGCPGIAASLPHFALCSSKQRVGQGRWLIVRLSMRDHKVAHLQLALANAAVLMRGALLRRAKGDTADAHTLRALTGRSDHPPPSGDQAEQENHVRMRSGWLARAAFVFPTFIPLDLRIIFAYTPI
jgi:hypothetical protein